MPTHRLPRVAVVWTVAAVATAAAARADVVYLAGGGKVVGKVVSATGASIRVRTVAGTLTFPAKRAIRIEYGPTPEEQYAERAAAVDRTDPAALMALADWCGRQGLNARERDLLRAVIALDGDHPQARRRLGYERVGTAWLPREQAMRARGLVRYGSRWVTPAERARLEQRDLERRLQRRWRQVILSVARRLESGSRSARRQAVSDLSGITDPLAIGPLVSVIGRTENAGVRATLVRALAPFTAAAPPGSPHARDDRALDALTDIALLDDDPDVRETALGVLVEANDPRVPAEFARALNQDSWTLKLRAAHALAALRDFETVPDLIRNLTVIEGYRREVSWSWRKGGFSHGTVRTYVPAYRERIHDGRILVREPVIEYLETTAGLRARPHWERKVVVRKRPIRSLNTEAWRALVAISGRDFGYYEDHWQAWYQQERRARRRARRRRDELKD